jgi:methylase of polypeptide subunit release factors
VKSYEPAMRSGEDVADRYDDDPRGDELAAVAFLEELAGGGPALELAIGTGRIALPLAAREIRVHGIDISPASATINTLMRRLSVLTRSGSTWVATIP